MFTGVLTYKAQWRQGLLSHVETVMVKMEKVWSNVRDPSALNAKCIDRDCPVRGWCPSSLSWRTQKSLWDCSSPQDVVPLFLVSEALYIRNLEPFSPLLGDIMTSLNLPFITVLFKSHFLPWSLLNLCFCSKTMWSLEIGHDNLSVFELKTWSWKLENFN